MGIFDEMEGVPPKQMVFFFLVDTSGSMDGEKIDTVNAAVSGVLPELKEAGKMYIDLKIACLGFSSGCKWMYPAPVEVEKFIWSELSANGETHLGSTFVELSDKMQTGKYLSEPSASLAPVIFLLTDGEPTDDYKTGFAALQRNDWYKCAIKAAIAIGDDVNIDVLNEFTGNPESVTKVFTPQALRKMIRFVALSSTEASRENLLVPKGSCHAE